MSPQIKRSAVGVYWCFTALFRSFINWLKSRVGALYKLSIINSDDLFSLLFSGADFQILFFTVMWNINFAEIQVFMNKNTHTSVL